MPEGFDFSKRRRNCACQVLRRQAKEQLVSSREVTGARAARGLRDGKPRMNETKALRSGSTIDIVAGTGEAAMSPFSFRTNGRGAGAHFNRINKRIFPLARYESATLTGNNANAINDERLSEIVARVQAGDAVDISAHCFVGAAFCHADESDLRNEHARQKIATDDDCVLAVNTDTGSQKKFCRKEIVADLVRQELE